MDFSQINIDDLKSQHDTFWSSLGLPLIHDMMYISLPIDLIKLICEYCSITIPYRIYKVEMVIYADINILDIAFKFKIINDELTIFVTNIDCMINMDHMHTKKRKRDSQYSLTEYQYVYDINTDTIVLKNQYGVVYKNVIDVHKVKQINNCIQLIIKKIQTVKKIKVCC